MQTTIQLFKFTDVAIALPMLSWIDFEYRPNSDRNPARPWVAKIIVPELMANDVVHALTSKHIRHRIESTGPDPRIEALQRIAAQDYSGQTKSDGAHLASIAQDALNS